MAPHEWSMYRNLMLVIEGFDMSRHIDVSSTPVDTVYSQELLPEPA